MGLTIQQVDTILFLFELITIFSGAALLRRKSVLFQICVNVGNKITDTCANKVLISICVVVFMLC